MNTQVRFSVLIAAFISAGVGLAACKPELEGINPQIVEQLKTPCSGEIQSTFRESSSGWILNISCVEEKKAQEKRDQMFEGLERVEPRSDGVNPLDY